jgi:small ligand-binding sensory domain FIST
MAKRASPSGAAFKAGLGAGGDWGSAVKACMNSLEPLPEGANLGLLYATDALAGDVSSILTFLREKTRIEHWAGNLGFGVAGCGIEYHDQAALAVLVAALPEDSFRVFEPVVETDDGLKDLMAAHGPWLNRQKPIFAIAHGDPRHEAIAEIVDQVAGQTSAFLAGGLTASRAEQLQVADRVTEGGLSGVFFGSGVNVATGLTQGCSPIGQSHTITKAEGNVIMAIDERPALEVFKEDIGDILAHDLRRVSGYIFVGFPVIGSDTGDYLVRNLTALDLAKGSISVGELVEPGQRVMFCRRDHEAAQDDLRRMLRDVKKRAGGSAKAAVYFSCIARGQNLFGENSEELKLIRDELGELPLAGFFANGEISNNRLYGYTGVLAVFL